MNGMDDNDDEHNFSDDDDFGSLPDDALQELEHNAVLSTQQPQKPASEHGQKPALPQYMQRANVLPHLQQALNESYDPDSFETLGEDRVPTPVEEVRSFIPEQRKPPGESTQREQWRVNRFGKPNPNPHFRPQVPPKQYPRYERNNLAVPLVSQRDPSSVSRTFGGTQDTIGAVGDASKASQHGGVDALSTRVAELVQERDRMAAELKQATDEAMTQKGEIAIIRENKDKETKVFDRQLAAMKKSMQEESTKHQATLDALSAKHSSLITEFNMTKDDLKEETRRIKSLEARLKSRAGEKAVTIETTPQKQMPGNSLRDGFDDDEIMVVSPAKSARRSKPTTPTVANKRKRKVDQSPIKPLVLRQSNDAPQEEDTSEGPASKPDRVVPIVRRDRQAERCLKLVQKVLNYQLKSKNERLIEALTQFALPSHPNRSFSTILLDLSVGLVGPSIPADLFQGFVDLWARSMKEKYYKCVPILREVIDFMLDVQTSVVGKDSISTLLPVLQESAAINGSIRFQHSPLYRSNFGQIRQTPVSALNPMVDSTACLALLYKVACLSVDSRELIDHFWRTMGTDFVLMMLHACQPVSDITLMLHLLATSIFDSTFGNICADPSTQNIMEAHIVQRVSFLLWETPKVDEGLPNLSRTALCHFRLQALELLRVLAIDSSIPPHNSPHHHGSVLLASHPSAIARIVRAIYDATASLYTMASTAPLQAQIINNGIRLLYHLMTQHGDEIDLQQKLSAVNGGVHKHRVVLTRLAFSEGWFIDADVTDETCALATALLEDSVTPDEAELMIQAFPGFNGRKKTQTASSPPDEDAMDLER